MLFYYSPGACSLAPHIVLEELGLEYELCLVSTSDGSTRSAEYRSINPKGRVPALVMEEGKVLTEVAAIMVYLALSHREPNLLDNSPEKFARAIEWTNWLASGVHALPVAQIWRTERFTTNQAHYESVQNKGRESLLDSYQLIEDRLQVGGWALGDAYSIVDPYLLVFYRWGNRLDVDMRSSFPIWTRHAQAMLERPAVLRVLDNEQISIWQ